MEREAETEAAATPTAKMLDTAGGQLLGFGALALLDAVMIAALVPRPPSLSTRFFHHAYDAAQLISLGLAASALIDLWRRWAPARARWALLALAALASASAIPILSPDLHGAVTTLTPGGNPTRWLVVFLALSGLGIAATAWIGHLLARPGLRFLGVALGLGAGVANHLLLENDYAGVHFYAAWAAATLIGASLQGMLLPAPLVARAPRHLRTGLRAAAALIAATALVVPPRNAVALELLRLSGSVVTPELARLRAADFASPAPASDNRWLAPTRPDVPPSGPPMMGNEGIVLLVIVDCLRADVIHSGKYADRLPTFEAMRKAGVEFSQARSPATGTLWTLSSLFSGRYYSQLYWTVKPGGVSAKEYPHEDTSLRFPEILRRAGVSTATITEMPDALGAYGIVGGFEEEEVFKGKTGFAERVAKFARKRLARQGPHPLFLYLHFLDAHAPYDRAGTQGTPFERYLGEVALIDAELGKLRRFLVASGLARRTTLILTADHGEAFGEHDTSDHGVSVYDELLRVPLLMEGPFVTPRRVEQPVSLLDLGPTVLDLFGQPTPGSFLGQSLTPLLRGQDPRLDRPLLADTGRLQQAMIFPDGYKAIRDLRRGTFELYDLQRDPGELHNLFDDAPDAEARLFTLRAFFQAQALRRPGYSPPFRP
ncbi:MAG: sulfatase [Minicystis sp.]